MNLSQWLGGLAEGRTGEQRGANRRVRAARLEAAPGGRREGHADFEAAHRIAHAHLELLQVICRGTVLVLYRAAVVALPALTILLETNRRMLVAHVGAATAHALHGAAGGREEGEQRTSHESCGARGGPGSAEA